jgi:hypothetical protein
MTERHPEWFGGSDRLEPIKGFKMSTQFNVGVLAASLAFRINGSDQYNEEEMADNAAQVALALVGSNAPDDIRDKVIEQYGDRKFLNLLAEEVDKLVAMNRDEFDGGLYNAGESWIREKLAHVIR